VGVVSYNNVPAESEIVAFV